MRRVLKVILILCCFVVGTAYANEATVTGHESGTIPKIVYYQMLNFFGLVAILYFVIKGKISGFFHKRREDLTRAIGESRRLREEAEKKHEEYTVKLKSLEREGEASLEKIKKDGEAAKQRLIEEAQKTVRGIEEETRRTINLEIEKAKFKIFKEAAEKSLNEAEKILAKSVDLKDDERLQKEFLNKIGTMK